MPYCINCGHEIQESWNACPNCGKVLKEVEAPQPVPQSYSQPQAPIQVQPYQKSYSSGSSNTYGIASLLIGVIGLCAGFTSVAIVVGIIAIVLGGLGISRDDNNSMAVIGLVLGILDVLCFVFFTFFIYSIFSSLFWLW